MALVRRTMENIRRLKPPIDCAKTMIPPQLLRKQLGMTQSEFAKALRIPLSTLRNWEQGRVLPDPAARSLLTIVAKNPKAALKALAA
jgi:putative transcriptional regulator